MERILFDGRTYFHPVTLPGMLPLTITIGSVSKEYRMIGWRIGWVVGPESIILDVALTYTTWLRRQESRKRGRTSAAF